MTLAEERSLPRRRALALAAGIVGAVVSIPMLAFVLRSTHLLDKFLT